LAASSRQLVLKIGKHAWKILSFPCMVNGWTSSGMADERKGRLQTRSVIRSCR